MTRARLIIRAVIVTVAGILGLGLGIPVAAAASVPAGSSVSLRFPLAAASAHSKPSARVPRLHHRWVRRVLITCSGHAVSRPKTFGLSCGDGADSLSGLRWSTWGPGRAVGQGTQRTDTCVPDCARGHSIRYRVAVILSGSERVARHAGERRYMTITLRYEGRHPAGVARQVSGALWP